MLVIGFQNEELLSLFEDIDKIHKKYPPEIAQSLVKRFADMRAAYSIYDVSKRYLNFINTDKGEMIAIQLGSNHEIVVSANTQNIPLLENGSYDWQHIKRLKILRIQEND